MPTAAEIRRQYPAFADLDDEGVVDAVQQAFYPDQPRERIAASLGVKAAEAPPEKTGLMRRIADYGISAVQGAVQVPQAAVGLADVLTGGRVGKALENEGGAVGFRPDEANAYLESLKSPEQQAANRAVQQAFEPTGPDDGLMSRIGRGAVAAVQNPSTIAHSIVQSLPSMGAGGVGGRAVIAAALTASERAAIAALPAAERAAAAAGMAPRAAGVASGIGEGVTTIGQQAEQIRTDESNPDRLLTGRQSALAVGSGAATGAIGAFSNKLAKSMGFETAENLLTGIHADDPIKALAALPRAAQARIRALPEAEQATAIAEASKPGFLRRVLGGAVTEGLLEELPQGVQEQLAQNMATGKPLDTDVPMQAVMGVLSGAAMGGGAQFFGGHVPHETKSAGDVVREELQPEVGAGITARAVNAGIEQAAQQADAMQPQLDRVAPATPRQANADQIAAIRRLPPEQQEDALHLLNLGKRMDVAGGVRRAAQNRLDQLLATAAEAKEEGVALAAGTDGQVADQAPALPAVAPPKAGDERDAGLARQEEALREEEARAAIAQRGKAPTAETVDVEPGDIVSVATGKPFVTIGAAMRQQAQRPGSELVRVEGGLVVRPPKETKDANQASAPRSEPDVAAAAGMAAAAPSEPASDGAGGDGHVGRVAADATERAQPAVAEAASERGGETAPARIVDQPDAALIDAAAHEAATSPTNDLSASEAQLEAGNAKVGRVRLHGLDISIEHPKGSTRTGTSASGEKWSRLMQAHYGYIRRTEGADGDHLDVYLGLKPDAPQAFVIDQLKADGSYDESKAMLGYASQAAAVRSYRQHYPQGFKVGPVTAMPMEQFKAWAASPASRGPASGSEARIGVARGESDAALQALDQRQGPDQQSGEPVLPQLRRAGSDVAPAVGDELSGIQGRSRAAPKPETQPGPDRERAADGAREDADAGRVGARDGDGAERAVVPQEPRDVGRGSGDDAASRWTAASPEQRNAALKAAGWLGGPGQQTVAHQPWADLTPGQRVRIGKALAAAPTTPEGAPPARAPKESALQRRKRLVAERASLRAEQYKPGNIIASPDGDFDKVIAFNPPDKEGRWSVQVQAVKKAADGTWKPNGRVRVHATEPDSRSRVVESEPAPAAFASEEGSDRHARLQSERTAEQSNLRSGETATRGPHKPEKPGATPGAATETTTAPNSSLPGQSEAQAEANQGIGDKPAPGEREAPQNATPPVRAEPSANTVFTEDAAAAARATLKRKLGQVSSGIDPEILQAGIVLAGYHIEKGARTFAAYAKAMVDDLGDAIRPYLKSFYLGVKFDPRAAAWTDMDTAAAVEAANVGEAAKSSIDDNRPQQQGAAQEKTDASSEQERAAPAPPSPAESGQATDPVDAPKRRRVRGKAGAEPRLSQHGGPDAHPGLFGPTRGGLASDNPAPNAPSIPAPQATDFRITDDLALGEGGQKTKFRQNIAAIQLVKDLEASGRMATADEQATLAKYVGWGGLPQAFDAEHADWKREHAELKGLLTGAEYETARESTQYAHYTSRPIIGAIYDALGRLGFTGGKILEPGSGVGNFIGLMPDHLRSSSRFTGVERESIAAGIARQLYPQQNIQRQDFAEFGRGEDGYFDVVIGNPPFARTALTDLSGRKHLSGLSVHNYFFAKGIDLLRPGGILAQVVSNSFLDAATSPGRRYIADRARFLGAIRLPNNAFAKNAGAEVTTDIVFLQKLPEAEWSSRKNAADRERWTGLEDIPATGGPLKANAYYAANHDQMLGEWGRHGTMYGPDQPALVARAGQDTPALLAAAVARLPERVYVAPAVAGTASIEGRTVEALRDDTVQEGGHYVHEDKLYRRIEDEAGEGRAVEITPETRISEKTTLGDVGVEKLKQLVGIRSTLRQLIAAEIAGAPGMEQLRRNLNRQYDAFVKEHGYINDRSTTRLYDDDPDFPLLASLEHGYVPGVGVVAARRQGIKPSKSSAKKAPIFSGRVIEARQAPTSAASPADALNISIAERGRVDVDYMAQLLGVSSEAALHQLTTGDKPLLFRDPASGEHVIRDAYLSGNVRVKLAQARAAGAYANVQALEAVQPEDVGAHEISARIGAPWLPIEVYADFAADLFGEGTTAKLVYLPINGSFVGDIHPANDTATTNTWGTNRYGGDALLLAMMNNREIKVTDRMSDGTVVLNKEATDAANQKAADIRDRFQDWVFKDGDRAEKLVRAYNDTNNNYVTRRYDGSYLSFPGKVPDEIIKFRRHQRNAIARIVQDRTALLDHVVGAGKTFTVVSGAMELKRTGLAKKSMVAVPNHLVKQWAADFYRLYPGANVLTATKKDFQKANRRRFLAKIATGDWDAVVIAHSSFGFIKPDPQFEESFNHEQVLAVMATINVVENSDSDAATKKRTVKQLAALKERLENRIALLRDKPIDGLLDFKEIGVDQLFVDEAHLFKNLMFSTKMQGVLGLGDPAGSQRAYDLYVKSSQVYAQNGRGQGLVFATGTPVSNSLAEMYHMQRYLMPDLMRDQFPSFDAWANTFTAVEQVWMQAFSGKGYKASNRMSTFLNAPELLKVFDQVADTVTMDDIKDAYREENNGAEFPLPKLKGGRRAPVSIPKSSRQEAYMVDLAARAAAIEGKRAEKGADNPLKIMGDGRKAAMDIRLVDLDATEREPGGRIDRAASEIADRWTRYAAQRGTQLVFSDLGTPISAAKAEMKEYETLQDRIARGEGEEVLSRAQLGDEAALDILEDVEAARNELESKGQDWLDGVKAALRGFSVYDDLKAALVERGIPENEVAFIHSYNTDDQKADLFRKVNRGDIRVLLGSTAKLGAGTNVQERLVALHHLDVPWKPSDVEQREGRILRQGNVLERELADFEVEILAYVTKDTLDMRMWQVQETKLKMINQLRTRKVGREIDNAFEDMELSAGEMQAAATGNMDLLREIQLRTDVKKLEQQARSYDAQRSDLLSRRKRNAAELTELPPRIERARQALAVSEQYTADVAARQAAFSVTIDGKTFTDPDVAAATLRGLVDATVKDGDKEKAAPLDVEFNGERYTARARLAEAFAEVRGDARGAPMLEVEGVIYNRISAAAKAIMPTVADALAEQKEVTLGRLGPFTVTGVGSTVRSKLGVTPALEITVQAGTVERSAAVELRGAAGNENDMRTLAERAISNAVQLASGGRSEVEYLQNAQQRAERTKTELDATPDLADWPGRPKLEAARAQHRDVLDRLKAKDKPKDVVEDGGATAFSRGDADGERHAGERHAQVQRLADRIAADWENAPPIVVIRDMSDPRVPTDAREMDARLRDGGAIGGPDAFINRGTVYLVSSALRTDADAARALLHESLGHFGLRGTYGRDLGTILDRLAVLKAGKVRTKARAYGLDFEKASDRRRAAEEVLAEMAETNPQLGWVRKTIAAIRTWMREHLPGYKSMMLSDDEIVRSYLLPARRFVTSGPVLSQRSQSGFPAAASRSPAPDQRDEKGDTAFSRSLAGVMNDVRDAKLPAGYLVGDLFNASGKLHWWHKTVGTMYNLARRNPLFRRVYEATQRFLNDTSRYANAAADEAPTILPKLEGIRDIAKRPLSAKDTQALSRAVNEGTLMWTRDGEGKLVRVEDAEKAAENLSTDDKAQKLFRDGKVSEAELKRWKATPLDIYDGAVRNRFEREYLKAGVVFTPQELAGKFSLAEPQQKLYFDYRRAIDRSLSSLGISAALRLVGKDATAELRTALLADTSPLAVDRALMRLRDHLWQQAASNPERAEILNGMADRVAEIANETKQLHKTGYAPLMRFGSYTLYVVPKDAPPIFQMFESRWERARAFRQMREAFPDAEIQQGTKGEELYKLFSGVTPETAALFGEFMGLSQTGDDAKDKAFQNWIKLTQSSRSSLRRLIHRKGIAGYSEDAGRVLAAFIVSNARRSSSNLHAGEIDAAVNDIPKEQGELQDAASKLADYIQNPREEAQGLRNLLFMQYLGGSVASAIVNATQPFAVTLPWLSQYGGAANAGRQLAAALPLARGGRTTGDKALDAALKDATERGIVAPQELHQLMAQAAGSGHLVGGDGTMAGDAWAKTRNAMAKLSIGWGKVFSVAELFNRRLTFIAAYRTAQDHGMPNPAAFAEDAVAQTQFTYNKGNRPQWARGAVGATLFTFKQYAINYLELLGRMWGNGPEGKKAVLLALALLFLVGGADGLPFMSDADDVIDGLLQHLGYNFSSKRARQEFLAGVLGEEFGRFVEKGVSGLPGVPIDVSGRMGLGNLLPGTGLFLKKEDHGGDVAELAGPVADLAKRGGQAVGHLLDGDIGAAYQSMMPVASRNIWKGIDMLNRGMYRDDKGRKVIDTNVIEGVLKILGFQPASVARVQEASGQVMQQVQLTRIVQQELGSRMAQAIVDDDQDERQAVAKALQRWNEANPEAPARIDRVGLIKRVHEMRLTKAERLAKTAPKGMRNTVREQLETAQ